MFLRVEVVNGVRHDVPRVDRLLQRVRDARHRHRPSEPILSTAKKLKRCITGIDRIWFFGRLPDNLLLHWPGPGIRPYKTRYQPPKIKLGAAGLRISGPSLDCFHQNCGSAL